MNGEAIQPKYINAAHEAFAQFMRQKNSRFNADQETLAEMLNAFEAGAQFGVSQVFAALRSKTDPKTIS